MPLQKTSRFTPTITPTVLECSLEDEHGKRMGTVRLDIDSMPYELREAIRKAFADHTPVRDSYLPIAYDIY